jgi:PKD repeat protein
MVYNFYKIRRKFFVLGLLFCISKISLAQVLYLNENFSTGSGSTPPSGWSNNIIAGTAGTDTWRFNNPGGRAPASPIAGQFAIFDSDNYSSGGGAEDVALESPAVNTTGYTTVKLKWDQFFAGVYNSTDGIYVEVFDGTSWNTVYSNTTLAYPGSASSQDIDVSTYAANKTGVKVRFRFVGDWSWYWIVDNVQLYTPVIDVAPTAVSLTKGTLCGEAADQIVVSVKNLGPAAQTNTPVVLQLSGTSTATLSGTITRSIAPNATDTIIFPGTYNTIPGYIFTMKAYTALGADLVRTNDTINNSITIIGTPNKPTITPNSRCGNGTVTLTATPGNVADSIYWYSSGSNTTPIATGATLTTPYLSTTTMFWASSSRGGLKDSLVSTYAAGNGQNGAMFDLVTTKTVKIDSFQYLSQTTGSITVEVYYKAGTYVGYESNSSAWTSLGTQTITAVAGNNRVVVSPLTIPSGQTYGIYFRTTGTLSYTNGTNTYTNSLAGVTMNAGVGISGTFAGTFTPRTWNGTIYFGGGCMSARDSANATVNPLAVGSDLLQGTPFQGRYNAGTYTNSDNTLSGNNVVYSIKPPTGYTNSGYGTSWSVNSYTVKTGYGNSFNGSVNFSVPASGNNATLSLTPNSADIDSTYEVTASIRLLATGCDTLVTRVIYIATIPTPQFSNNSACFGSNTNFYDSSSTIRGGLKYFWDFGDAGTADTSVLKSPAYMYSASGTYTVNLTVTNDYGYSATISKSVTVGYSPITNFAVQNKCEGDSTVFTNTTTINGPAVTLTYLWDFGDGTTSIVTDPKNKYTAIGVYNVSLTATTPLGCKNTISKVTTVFAKPKADFSAQSVCAGTDASFTNLSTLAQGMLGSDWLFGDGTSSTSSNPNHSYDAGGNYNVKLVAYSNFGCKDSITKSLTIKPLPTAVFTSNGLFCHGDSISFTNGSSFSAGSFTSEWDFGTGTYTTNNASSFKYKFATSGTYKVRLKTTGNGCSAETSTNMVVEETPVTIFGVNGTVCKKVDLNLTNNSSGAGTLSYSWTFGDASTSTSQVPVKSYAAQGNYTITLAVSSSNGCSSSSNMPITVNDLPVATYSYNKISPSGRQLQFTPTVANSAAYLWEYGDGNISNQISPVYSYLSNGPFIAKLTVTDSLGCKDTSSQIVGFNVSTGGKIANTYQFEVYPNPFQNATTVGFTIAKISKVEVVLLDMNGKNITTLVNESKVGGKYEVNLDANQLNLRAGTYFVRLTVDGNVQNKQIIQVK